MSRQQPLVVPLGEARLARPLSPVWVLSLIVKSVVVALWVCAISLVLVLAAHAAGAPAGESSRGQLLFKGEGDESFRPAPPVSTDVQIRITGMIGQGDNAVISAHRDTHFRFLRRISAGDTLIIQTADGVERVFQVADTQVVDEEASIIPDTSEQMLTLITCYLFDDVVPGGSLRFLVFAVQRPILAM